jgi:hypothetical protein
MPSLLALFNVNVKMPCYCQHFTNFFLSFTSLFYLFIYFIYTGGSVETRPKAIATDLRLVLPKKGKEKTA